VRRRRWRQQSRHQRERTVIPTPDVPGTDFDDPFAVVQFGPVCTAVGSAIDLISGQPEPLAERWEDGRWSIQQPSVNAHAAHVSRELYGVSCPSRISCTAVGLRFAFDHRPLIERWSRPIAPVVTGFERGARDRSGDYVDVTEPPRTGAVDGDEKKRPAPA
jgi:hypothetical protein